MNTEMQSAGGIWNRHDHISKINIWHGIQPRFKIRRDDA